MASKVTSPAARCQEDVSRLPHHPKPKREFLVESHRKEFDDYMLTQLKKNKKSVKHIKKTIDQLRTQMDELKDQNRKQRYEFEQLTHQVKTLRRLASQPKTDLTSRRSPKTSTASNCLHKTRKQFVVSKQSSFSAKSSAVQPKGKSLSSLKSGGRHSKQESSSKTILKRKIEDLKEKAHLIKQNAQQIQQEINRKIERKLEHSPGKNQPSCQNNDTKAYEELMELLKTNKRIQEPVPTPPQPQPVESKQELSLNIEEARDHPQCSDKSMLSTNRDPTPLKNSAAVSYYEQKPPSPLPSQTNLLDSDKNIFPRCVRPLKLSRCVNVQVMADEGQQSEFEGLLRECRGSGSELSFEGPDSEQQLKEMEFEFDQLVRQELMSNEPKEKQVLGNAIRSLLEKISALRQQLTHSN